MKPTKLKAVPFESEVGKLYKVLAPFPGHLLPDSKADDPPAITCEAGDTFMILSIDSEANLSFPYKIRITCLSSDSVVFYMWNYSRRMLLPTAGFLHPEVYAEPV